MLVKANHLLPSSPIFLSPARAERGLTAHTDPCSPAPFPAPTRLGVSQLSGRAVRGQPAPAHSQDCREGLLLAAERAPEIQHVVKTCWQREKVIFPN